MATFENEQLGVTVELDEMASHRALIEYEQAAKDALDEFERTTDGTLSRAIVIAAFEAGLIKRIEGKGSPRATEDVDDAPFPLNWWLSEAISNWIADRKLPWPKKSPDENGRRDQVPEIG